MAMTIERAKTLATAEMQKWGLIQKGWVLRFNKRKRSLGLCSPAKRTIYLSTYYFDRVSDAETMDTIRHEIAHALEAVRHGTSGHGPVWKAIAREVGATPVTKCQAKIDHAYPYVIRYEGKFVRGYFKLPPNIHARLATMGLRGKPESRGKLKLFRVSYKKVEK